MQVTIRQDHLEQHIRTVHLADHLCPYPGCKAKAMPVRSLVRHRSIFGHSSFFDLPATFSLCGWCGKPGKPCSGCDSSKPLLEVEDLVEHLGRHYHVLPRYL